MDQARRAGPPSEPCAARSLLQSAVRPVATVGGMSSIGPVAEVGLALDRIAEVNDALNSFITVDREGALAAAAAAQSRLAAGVGLGPLDGACVAIKDCIDTAGLRTTSGSALRSDHVPAGDAEVVARLRAAGAVIVGKTNMTEFACGTAGANPFYGDVVNPHDRSRWAGGSSGGSAAAVAAGLVRFALGTDTSCSVRYPAAVSGVVGFKPTWGRVSNAGVLTVAVNADHIGTLTTSVADAASLLAVIQDDGWADPSIAIGRDVVGLRAAVLTGPFTESCDRAVLKSFESAIVGLDALGVSSSALDLGIDLVEADDQLSICCSDLVSVHGDEFRAAPPGMLGEVLLSWLTLFEAVGPRDYERSLERRRELRARLATVFERFDVLVCPTARRPAGRYSELARSDRDDRSGNCSLFGFTGLPAISVPIEPTDGGLPVGMQIVAADGADETALAVANALLPGRVPTVDSIID